MADQSWVLVGSRAEAIIIVGFAKGTQQEAIEHGRENLREEFGDRIDDIKLMAMDSNQDHRGMVNDLIQFFSQIGIPKSEHNALARKFGKGMAHVLGIQ